MPAGGSSEAQIPMVPGPVTRTRAERPSDQAPRDDFVAVELRWVFVGGDDGQLMVSS